MKWDQRSDAYCWRPWFAWYPVRVVTDALFCGVHGSRIIWLEYVERSRHTHGFGWFYREKE